MVAATQASPTVMLEAKKVAPGREPSLENQISCFTISLGQSLVKNMGIFLEEGGDNVS